MAEDIVKTNPDPTKNVLDLVKEAIKRLDDLAAAETRRIDAMFSERDKRYEQKFTDLKVALDSAIAERDKSTLAALAAQKEAVNKAEASSEKRFEGVNEFRSTLSDQQRTLMPRAEAEVKFEAAIGWILAAITIIGFIISNALRIR